MSNSERQINQVRMEFSQNFIKSPELVKSILRMTNINSQDTVVEIGPGKGIITEQLSYICKKVIAVEKDTHFYRNLCRRFQDNHKIDIRRGDFLRFELPQERYKIFSNIPFNLTAEIINKLTLSNHTPEDSYLIVQKEAASRFAGLPHEKEPLISLLLKPRFDLSILSSLERTNFQPEPRVDTVLLLIHKRGQPILDSFSEKIYRDFVTFGFCQWSLNLQKASRSIFTHRQFEKLSADLKFNILAKPSDLGFEQWLGLFSYFIKYISKDKKKLIIGSEAKLKKQQSKLQKWHRTTLSR